jgi:1,2-diacylglycerol 3-alpha-glucosyltransferase
MRICHFTNTFLPHVGGVARAVQTLLEDQRRARHRVLVVAPEFAEGPAPRRIERSVERIPALTHFNDSDFSVRLPVAAALSDRLASYKTDLIHAHHPFLLGDTALREAASRQVPIIFTHHTLYERYTHYLPFDSEALQGFAAELATRYANRCTAVIAPSASVRDIIVSRGVTVPVHVVPTGIDTAVLARGQGARARQRWGIPAEALVIGHLGRLALEKNLLFLAQALVTALGANREAWGLIVGDGPARRQIDEILAAQPEEVRRRVVMTGKLTGQRLHDACAAMQLFAFASTSETQGLVLAESMAAGAPVVALDASGAREVVRDGENGRLLPAAAAAEEFAAALSDALRDRARLQAWSAAARTTAASFDRSVTSAALLQVYGETCEQHRLALANNTSLEEVWDPFLERLATEVRLLADKAGSIIRAFAEPAHGLRGSAGL